MESVGSRCWTFTKIPAHSDQSVVRFLRSRQGYFGAGPLALLLYLFFVFMLLQNLGKFKIELSAFIGQGRV